MPPVTSAPRSAGFDDSVKSQVPIEFEIERARRMVKNLVPDIRKNMHVIAQEEVEIERLDKQIAQTSSTMDKDKAEIMKLKGDLATVQPVYHYARPRPTRSKQVKVDLANRFERYKTHDATLASLREIQAARRKSLDAARQKLDGMIAGQAASWKSTSRTSKPGTRWSKSPRPRAPFNIDDSQLGRVKDLIAEVRTRLNVAERLVNAQGDFDGEIPLSGPQSENIVDQVTEYFSAEKPGRKWPRRQPRLALSGRLSGHRAAAAGGGPRRRP